MPGASASIIQDPRRVVQRLTGRLPNAHERLAELPSRAIVVYEAPMVLFLRTLGPRHLALSPMQLGGIGGSPSAAIEHQCALRGNETVATAIADARDRFAPVLIRSPPVLSLAL